MRLEHSFVVPVPVDQAWGVLLDVERIAPCMPGAALTEYSGDDFAGTVRVKLGPVNLLYKGSGRFLERDEAARRVVLEASGRDTRSAGTAAATVTSTLHPADDGTRVQCGHRRAAPGGGTHRPARRHRRECRRAPCRAVRAGVPRRGAGRCGGGPAVPLTARPSAASRTSHPGTRRYRSPRAARRSRPMRCRARTISTCPGVDHRRRTYRGW